MKIGDLGGILAYLLTFNLNDSIYFLLL